MGTVAILLIVCATASGLMLATGWWRLAFAPFGIRSASMTVERLGLHVSAGADAERVDSILASFAGGFNAMIAAPSATAWRRYCDSLPSMLAPFAHEGAAMGYTLRHLFRYNASDFEHEIVKPRPEFRYLYYVGLGFWSGMRGHSPAKLARITANLDPLHRYLCYDGYGFKFAFFDDPKNPDALRVLDGLEGYEKNAAYQGVGRALFFRFMNRPDLLIERARQLGSHSEDAAAGFGLAAVFVNPERLDVACTLGEKLPASWQRHYHLGMCFGLKARSINNLDRFEEDISQVPDSVREAVWTSIRECDRIELHIRSDRGDDGYRRWRASVTDWMAAHIAFPMQRIEGRDGEGRADAVRRADAEVS